MNTPILTPRHFWLRERTLEIIEVLTRLELRDDWENYRKLAKEFAEELLYCVTEWEKYYSKLELKG